MPPLLQTKLMIPALPTTLISRPRLWRQIDQGLWQENRFARKLTLVTAPAGYGKTTLVAEWVQDRARSQRERGEPVRVGWLTLDEDDNDPVRFFTHLFAALGYETADGDEVSPVRSGIGTVPVQRLLTPLVNRLAAAGRPQLLVLDDIHLLEAESVYESLRFLLRQQPPTLHLVLAGRRPPRALPLARLRARAELREVNMQALCFTQEETASFFRDLGLAPEQLRALQVSTEGWAAGLQLARLALGRGAPLLPGVPVDPLTHGEGGYLLDYLAEEVIAGLSVATVRFLEQTAILQQLCPSLCGTVTGRDDSGRLLAELAQAGLFLIRLDKDREWYRYHPLFARFLRARLQQADPALVPRLHRRAATWYAAEGIVHAAVRHGLATGDEGYALSLIERYRAQLLARGELATLRGWVEALPARALDNRPALALAYGWALVVGGHSEATAALLKRLEPAVDRQHEGELLALQAAVARFRGDEAGVRSLGPRALAALPAEAYHIRGIVTLYLATALLKDGEAGEAQRLMTAAHYQFRARGDGYMETQALYHLINAHIFQGQLTEGDALCRRAFAVMDTHGLPYRVGGFHYCSGLIRWEWNDLPTAKHYLEEGYQIGRANGHLPFAIRNALLLADVLRAQRDEAAARQLLTEVRRLVAGSPRQVTDLARGQARLALLQGQPGAAERWVEQQQLTVNDEPAEANFYDYVLLVHLALFRKEFTGVRPLLEQLLKRAQQRGSCGEQIELLLALGRVQWAEGRNAVALRTTERALILGEPGAYVRRFVDGGAEVARLLYQLRDRYQRGSPATIAPLYLARLLATFGDGLVPEKAPAGKPEPFTLEESLTPRETEIMRLLGQGLTNPEMAEQLQIAVGTVNWHVKNIYKKLRVGNRVEATVRARELGLVG